MSRAILVYLRSMSKSWISLLNDAALMEHLDRLDRLPDALGMSGHGVGVHDLTLDEVDDQGALGVDLVGDRRPDAGLGRLDHAVALDVPVDEHVGADAGHAHDVLLAALLGAAVHPHDVVVVGDAAAELLGADLMPLPVGDAGDDVLRREVGLLSHSSCLSLRAALRPRGCRRCQGGASRAPSCRERHPRRREAGGDDARRTSREAQAHETGTSRPMPASSSRTSSMAFW